MSDAVLAPAALMLLAPGCAHCPAELAALCDLLKRSVIGRLEVVNIAAHPEVAQQYGVRSVPWVRLGEFELSGARTSAELERWAQRVGSAQGRADYLVELLKSGTLHKAIAAVDASEQFVDALIILLADPHTELQVRIGIGAVFEHLSGSAALQHHLNALGALTLHADARVRADACHYLSLGGDVNVLRFIEPLLNDIDAHVREIARESVDALR
jgi:thioredoxin-like negative regulator of GroEL